MTRQETIEIESAPKIGVLSYQGNVREHLAVLEAIGVRGAAVNTAREMEDIRGLIIPGGESTTIGKLMRHFGLDEVIRRRYKEGMAVFGTCAGLILMAKDIEASDQPRLGLMDITAARNAFGRQIASFEVDLPVRDAGIDEVRAVFIRAPYISRCGEGVQALAEYNGRVVLARQGRLLASAFHPEQVGETRLHRYFAEIATGARA